MVVYSSSNPKSFKNLYGNGHYANAEEDAIIEINERVKKLFVIVKPGEKGS